MPILVTDYPLSISLTIIKHIARDPKFGSEPYYLGQAFMLAWCIFQSHITTKNFLHKSLDMKF